MFFLPFGSSVGLLCMIVGVPIFISFALGGIFILAFHLQVNWYAIGQAMSGSVMKYSLVALPMYILLGYFMLEGGLARRLTDVSLAWFGHLRGGLAISAIVAVAVFSAISGSILASIITIGAIMIPIMTRNGYPKPLATAIIASAAGVDSLIPPSAAAIVYCSVTGSSVAKVFMAGLIPGLIQAFLLLVVSVILCRKFPTIKAASWRTRLVTTYKASPVLFMVVMILGGIYLGWLLPTEAAAIACILALFVGFFIYRELTLRTVWRALVSSGRTISVVFIIIACASFLSLVLVYTQIPQNLTSTVIKAGLTPIPFLLLAAVALLITGTFLEAVPNMLITLPIFMPICIKFGVDLVGFFVPFAIFIGIGLLTPPVAVGAYTAASVGQESPDKVFRYLYPWFVGVMILSGVINIIWPQISLWIPNSMK